MSIEGLDWAKTNLDLVFCALLHATTQSVLKGPLLCAPGTKVVDLSADFRLQDPSAYERWHGNDHKGLRLQKEVIYGLVDIYQEEICKAQLVANPDSYTTCAQLPLIPLPSILKSSVQNFAERHDISASNAFVRVHRAGAALRKQLLQTCVTWAEHGCFNRAKVPKEARSYSAIYVVSSRY